MAAAGSTQTHMSRLIPAILAGAVAAFALTPDIARADTLRGQASYYSHAGRTANGEVFRPDDMTAAHRTLPFGARVRVTDVLTRRSIVVRINDRGPFTRGRIIDVSRGAAEVLGMTSRGVAAVELEVVN
jgi:rare lipoprotein A